MYRFGYRYIVSYGIVEKNIDFFNNTIRYYLLISKTIYWYFRFFYILRYFTPNVFFHYIQIIMSVILHS